MPEPATYSTRRAPHEIPDLPGIPPCRLLHVPGGEFLMGSADDDKQAYDNEKPAHRVRLVDFYLGEFPVTQDLWEAATGENPSNFKGPSRPVEQVSWNDIVQKFLPALREKTGHDYRLPTEAEWEYAARGGPFWESEPFHYAGSDRLEQVGWFDGNSGYETREVGLLLPNALGLYDMSGNVWEWCADWYGGSAYYAVCRQKDVVESPAGPEKGDSRVLRGGGYFRDAQNCRAAFRNSYGPANRSVNLGFRLALSPQSVG